MKEGGALECRLTTAYDCHLSPRERREIPVLGRVRDSARRRRPFRDKCAQLGRNMGEIDLTARNDHRARLQLLSGIE